jgi:hypothetical protein
MKTIVRVIAFAAVMSAPAAAQTCQPDADAFVKEALKHPRYAFTNSFDVHHAGVPGDSAAIVLMSNLRLSDLNNPDIAQVAGTKARDLLQRLEPVKPQQ